MKRVAIFLPNLEGGGAERAMLTLAHAFERAGHAVDLVLQSASGPYLREVESTIRVIDLKASRLIFAIVPLARYFRSARPRAILSTPVDANIVAVLARAVSRIRAPLTVREAVVASADESARRDRASRILAAIRRSAYHFAAHVVAPSAGVADDLISRSGIDAARISVIANPIDAARIRDQAALPADLQHMPTGRRVIVGIGRLVPQKDFTTLIRAFAILPGAYDAVLLLLGEGEQRAEIERLASTLGVAHKVVMPGWVANPFAYLARADVFVLSSRYEGLPNAMLQALILGTPVVATDCESGPRDILEAGRWGRLVPVGDVDAMAKGIVDALEGRVATPPLHLMEERYAMTTIAQQYLDVMFASDSR